MHCSAPPPPPAQCLTDFRKPLVLVSPKMILRHPMAASPLAAFGPGTHFRPVLPDPDADPQRVTKVSRALP